MGRSLSLSLALTHALPHRGGDPRRLGSDVSGVGYWGLGDVGSLNAAPVRLLRFLGGGGDEHEHRVGGLDRKVLEDASGPGDSALRFVR